MSRRSKPQPAAGEPASLILLDYGGYTVWMEPEKAQTLAAKWRKSGKRLCLVHRKVTYKVTSKPACR